MGLGQLLQQAMEARGDNQAAAARAMGIRQGVLSRGATVIFLYAAGGWTICEAGR